MRLDLRGFWPVRRLGSLRGAVVTPARPLIAVSQSLGESAHSFLAEPMGELSWSGPVAVNYIGMSNVDDRWNANGADRTADYDGALIVAIFGDFSIGTFAPDSPEGVNELQYLDYYAQTAEAKGCQLMLISPPHTPPGAPDTWDMETMSKTITKAAWLNARPGRTIRTAVIPMPILARRLVEYYAPASIFRDGLHMNWREPGMAAMRGMGLLIHATLTGARYAGPLSDAEDGVMADMAWEVARDYACTGLGGSIVIPPWPMAGDPLPDPAPLPAD